MNPNIFLAVIALLSLQLALMANATTVSIMGRQLLVDGEPFFARGVCYDPTPIGQVQGLRQICGEKRDQPCPYDWFQSSAIYNRDLKWLQQINANLVRLYSWEANILYTPFLDACYAHGIYVLIGIPFQRDANGLPDLARMKLRLQDLVLANAAHPAILGWLVGNEINLHTGTYLPGDWAAVQELKNLAHTLEAPLWHPVGSPISDSREIYHIIGNATYAVDIWYTQLYRGPTFGDFFKNYAKASTKPVIISEFGVDSYYNASMSASYGERAQGQFLESLLSDLDNNRNVTSGGAIFQSGDGWWKCGINYGLGINGQDNCSTPYPAFPGGFVNQEYFGIVKFVSKTRVDDISRTDSVRFKFSALTVEQHWATAPRKVPYKGPHPVCGDFILTHFEVCESSADINCISCQACKPGFTPVEGFCSPLVLPNLSPSN